MLVMDLSVVVVMLMDLEVGRWLILTGGGSTRDNEICLTNFPSI